MNDLNGKVGRVSELEEANLQLDIEAREARDARRRADGLLAEEARKVADAIKAFEEYKLANPPRIGTYVDKGNQSANMDSPSKPKRKAHWSALHQDRRSVQDSQSQPAPVPSPARPTTPQGPVVDFFAQFEDDEEPLDDIAALFPPTPDPSSQNLRPTVKFVQDSIQSIESRSYYASQTRNHYASQTTDHFASDHLSSDYITMSQVEETVPRLKQEASQSAGASQKSTATHSPRTILPDSQPSQPRPKSILKASQPAKRTAEDAGLQPAADRPARRRGGLRAESQSLGPVIPESQSQNGSQSQARSRRLSRPAVLKRKGECRCCFPLRFMVELANRFPDDKFSRRFSQELGE